MSEPVFLGFGAFETTAFCTSIIVAWYSLVPNPSGRQSAHDRAEYQIFAGWRLALLAIVSQIILMIIVILQQANASDVDTTASVWLLLLMIAPWAPISGHVRATLTAGSRIRTMMKARLARNEVTAILRDRFKFGQRSIAMPSVIYHVSGKLPTFIVRTLEEQPDLALFLKDLKYEAMVAAQVEEEKSLELGSLWAMNQSMQPTSVSRRRLLGWKVVSNIDILARLWTGRTCNVRVDVMPGIRSELERARYLDVVDLLQQGGTVSDELATRGLKRFCERCRLSIRCGVEAFLESSERGHTDMRAGKWLQHVGMDWRGSFERVIDVMWEACFMDSKALRLSGEEHDLSPSYNDRTKVTTTKMLALLFVISRSLVSVEGDAKVFDAICYVVAEGPFGRQWWTRYWSRFCEKVREKNGGRIVVDEGCRSVFKACLRDLVDEDMFDIVQLVLQCGMRENMCGHEGCFLKGARLIATNYGPERHNVVDSNPSQALNGEALTVKRKDKRSLSVNLHL